MHSGGINDKKDSGELNDWKKKLAAWVEDEQVGEWLFFLAFAVYLGLWGVADYCCIH